MFNVCKVYKAIFLFFAFGLFVFNFSACSLDYGIEEESQNTIVPEMILNDVDFSRIDRGVKVLTLNAESLELFSEDDTIFGKNTQFWLYSRNGECTSYGN